MIETVTAWAAGLFEGEGSISVCGGRPRLQLKMCDEETVRRFAAAVECGRVYGPYGPYLKAQRDGYIRNPTWVWLVEGEAARTLATRFGPWLSAKRLARAQDVFSCEIAGAA